MENRNYLAPEVTVVYVLVEKGCQTSGANESYDKETGEWDESV